MSALTMIGKVEDALRDLVEAVELDYDVTAKAEKARAVLTELEKDRTP